jgi:hypothetical protein
MYDNDDGFVSLLYGWYTGLKDADELIKEYDIEDIAHRDRKILTKQLETGGY